MQIQQLISLINKKGAKLLVLLCHNNADPDAMGAAYAFSGLLKRLKPSLEIEIVAASGPSKLSKAMMKVLPINLINQLRVKEADIIALIDTSTIQQLYELNIDIRADQSLIPQAQNVPSVQRAPPFP